MIYFLQNLNSIWKMLHKNIFSNFHKAKEKNSLKKMQSLKKANCQDSLWEMVMDLSLQKEDCKERKALKSSHPQEPKVSIKMRVLLPTLWHKGHLKFVQVYCLLLPHQGSIIYKYLKKMQTLIQEIQWMLKQKILLHNLTLQSTLFQNHLHKNR